MKLKIDRGLLPIKAHFFFFFAALGPILPQLNVFGRQLGVSPAAMGAVTAVLPLLWALAKPLFGYVVDFWPAHRKLIFMLLIATMTGSYCCLWFLPTPEQETLVEYVYHMNDTIYIKPFENSTSLEKYNCHWNCSLAPFDVYLPNQTYVNTVFVDGDVKNTSCSLLHMEFDEVREGEVICLPKSDCNLLCYEDELNRTLDSGAVEGNSEFYMTVTFWAFVVLMCVGTVAFNVANCIGDAVCFDVLGPDRGSKYGSQRAWGTVGYGLTALLSGWLVDLVSGGYKNFTPAFLIALVATAVDLYSCRRLTGGYKDFTPAFLIALIATAVDLYSCRRLTMGQCYLPNYLKKICVLLLPPLASPADSGAALRAVLRMPRVLLFVAFAVVAGTFDSFIIYYMFWFLEELAEETSHTAKVKLIEGVVVAAQSFIGELIFFAYSGRIIKRWGYGATLTFSLLCYGIRMALISVIRNPWHLVFIEGIMQGPTYALCYSTIVGYAACVAPEGYSATIQGIVAGMDDGLGFAIGSLAGGQLYSYFGGRSAFRLFGGAAIVASGLHAVLFAITTRNDGKKTDEQIPEEDKMLSERSHVIYRDTVQPLAGDL